RRRPLRARGRRRRVRAVSLARRPDRGGAVLRWSRVRAFDTQIVVAIVVAGVSAACRSSAPICEQAEFDACTPCANDKDCNAASQHGEVCAPDLQCWPPNELQTVTVNWTIGGQPANATTCQGKPSEFDIFFDHVDTLKPDTI